MSVELTILMPTRNRANVLRTTLEAMCRVRRDGLSVELVVVDNGSTDGTADVLREFESRLPLKALREPTAGKCRALNRALHELELGDIVVFTDDDVTPDESWLEAIVSVCERWPKHSVFGGRVDVEWPSGVPAPSWAKHKGIQQMAFAAHHIGEREGEYPPELEPFGPNYWVRRHVLAGVQFLESIGPHPTRRTLSDETHFLRQLRRRGLAPVYSRSARVRHRIEPERATKEAVYRRAFQYGLGMVHTQGMPEESLRRRSRAAWQLRLASNVGVGALAVLGAALEPDENRRFARLVSGLVTLAKNVEALRSTIRGSWSGASEPALKNVGASGTDTSLVG
jgi:glycosyltransferase involved in cell wall biosynthesis